MGSNKKLSTVDVLKLTNLSENYSITELVNNCLAKNKKDTLKIINENNFSPEDCVIITRSMLYAAKRLLKLLEKKDKISNLEQLITSHKPPIFWKDKEIIKQQLKNLSLNEINIFIKKVNNLELTIKKNSQISNQIINNFILEKLDVSNNLI